ncbi:MAG: ABC transporter permease [Candidatus Methanosuratincola sp.]
MKSTISPSKIELFGILLIIAVLSMAVFSLLPGRLLGDNASKPPYSPPSIESWLGTNDVGEDVFHVLLKGSRVSLTIGFLGATVSTLIGTLIGIVAGYLGGCIDDALGATIDIFLVVPALPMMIVLAAYLGPSFLNVVLVIGLLWWPTTARLVRARARQVSGSLFIESLVGIGAGRVRLLFRHILPNVIGVVFARFVLAVSSSILLEAGLSFIGLGDPQNPSWGLMLHYAMTRGAILYGAWWTFLPPGICISATALGFTLISMGIEYRFSSGTRKIGDFE